MKLSVLFVGCALCTSYVHAESYVVVDLDHATDKPRILLVENGTITHEYPIAAPQHTPACLLAKDGVTGTITDIIHEAAWGPPPGVKRKMARKGVRLKDYYGPFDPKNALGGRKFMIVWDDPCIDPIVRIHGTIEPKYVLGQQRVSSGCIRMLNEHWNELAAAITPNTLVYFTVQYKNQML